MHACIKKYILFLALLNKNNIVRTFGVGSVVECGQRCASCFPECKSFNYKHSENFVDTLCDINNTTKRGHPERSLIEDVNSIYGEILNPLFEVYSYCMLLFCSFIYSIYIFRLISDYGGKGLRFHVDLI